MIYSLIPLRSYSHANLQAVIKSVLMLRLSKAGAAGTRLVCRYTSINQHSHASQWFSQDFTLWGLRLCSEKRCKINNERKGKKNNQSDAGSLLRRWTNSLLRAFLTTGLRTAAVDVLGDGPSPWWGNSGPGWGAESEHGRGGARYRPPPAGLLLRVAGSAAEWEWVLRAAPAEGRHSERERGGVSCQSPDHMTLEEEELTAGKETAETPQHWELLRFNATLVKYFLYLFHVINFFLCLCKEKTTQTHPYV